MYPFPITMAPSSTLTVPWRVNGVSVQPFSDWPSKRGVHGFSWAKAAVVRRSRIARSMDSLWRTHCRAVHDGAIEGEGFRHGLLEAEVALEGPSGGLAEFAALRGIGEQAVDGRGKRAGILRWDEQARPAVLYCFGDTTHVGRD